MKNDALSDDWDDRSTMARTTMIDMSTFHRTNPINVTRCPHCGRKFRVTAQRDGQRISPWLVEGRSAYCPLCGTRFVMKFIPDEAESRRSAQQFVREFDRLTRENQNRTKKVAINTTARCTEAFTGCKAIRVSPLGCNRSLVPSGKVGAFATGHAQPRIGTAWVMTNGDYWSSYNPQSSCVTGANAGANIERLQPPFRWGAWGCSTVLLGLLLFVPIAVVLMAVLGEDVGGTLGLIAGMLLAGIVCYQRELQTPARKRGQTRTRQLRTEQLRHKCGPTNVERWLQERAAFRAQHPELSYESYLAERGMGEMGVLGQIIVGALAIRFLGVPACLADYPLWKAEKQAKIKTSTGWAIRLGLAEWSHRNRTRREEDERMN